MNIDRRDLYRIQECVRNETSKIEMDEGYPLDLKCCRTESTQSLRNLIESSEFPYDICICPVPSNLRSLAIVKGPKDSLYEDGIFVLEIQYPQHYPFVPLQLRFLTKIYHFNVNDSDVDFYNRRICAMVGNDHELCNKESWRPSISTGLKCEIYLKAHCKVNIILSQDHCWRELFLH